MPWYYAPWISHIAGYAVLIGAAAAVIYSIYRSLNTPRTRYIIRSGDIIKAIERDGRKCGCGIFVACDKHSREFADTDEQLEREGK
jgi:hypothetical protein